MLLKIRSALAVTALCALSVTTACSSSSSDSSTASKPLSDATILNSPTSLIQQVAVKKGFYKKRNLDVKLIGVKDGPSAAALVTSGGADIGDIAGPTLVTLAAGNTPVKFLSDAEASGFDLIGLKSVEGSNAGKPYPKNILDVKGHKVGVPARGSAIEAVVTAMLVDAGLNPDKDVTWVATGGAQTTIAAMKNNQIDYTAWPSSITRTLFASSLDIYVVGASDKGTAGSVADNLLSGAEVVLAKNADARKDQFVDYCLAMTDAGKWMKDAANEQALGKIAQDWLGLPDLKQGITAGNLTAKTAINSLSKKQWDANTSLFAKLGSPNYEDAIFKPCFTA